MASRINADNGVVSGISGINYTGDNSGVMALQTNGNTAVTIDSSGNVGIGTASPATKLSIATTGADVEIRASATTSGNVRVGFDASGAYYDWIQVDRSSGDMRFAVANSERMRILNSGNILSLSGGSTTATGTGIAFPATQSASSDANTLDDYEEGTFTPTFTNISGGATKGGAYVKIGRMVFVNIYFGNMACTGTSAVTIGGLPFTRSSSASSDGDALTPYELYQISNPTGNLQWLFCTSSSSTTVSPVAYNGTTGASITTANFSFASATLGISGWYQAAT